MTIDAHWLASCALATGVVATTACLRTDADHCMFTGGDVSCLDRACGAVLEGHALHSSDPMGCVDLEAEDPGTYVHVKYGLLLAVASGEGVDSSESRPRTVEDVLRLRIGDDFAECELDGDAVREAVEGTAAIWRRLEHLGIRKSEAYLTSTEVQVIETLAGVIDGLLETCGSEVGTSGGTTDATMSSGTSATGGMSTAEGPECTMSADCWIKDPTQPICVAGVCLPCYDADDDASCAMKYPETPACVVVGEDAGSCVQCTSDAPLACTGATPVCDGTTHICVPCIAHEQCGDAACNFFTGACLPANAVFHVGGNTPDYADLASAVANTGKEVTIIVHVSPMTYNESVTIDGGRVVALLGAGAGSGNNPPRWVRSSGDAPQLTVGSDTTMLMDGLELIGNASSEAPGLLVDGGRAWIDRSRIVANIGGGIVAENNSELVVRNSFVGGSINGVPALAIDGATATLTNTTVIGGLGVLAEALSCTPESTVTVTDSIILLQSDNSPVTCDPATFDHSASEIGLPGSANENVGGFDDISTWFVSVAMGDFHLSPTGTAVFADLARWTIGDPPTDIDGDLRPTTNDTPDFAGADAIPR